MKLEVFTRLRERRERSLIIISHQERILSIADEIIVVAGGRVRTAGPRQQILPGLLADERTARCPLEKGDAQV